MKKLLQKLFRRLNKTPDAAQFSFARSWRPTSLQDARLDVSKTAREVLQARSRDFDLDSPLYSKIADLWEQYVCGSGLQLRSNSSSPVWNLSADRAWARWKSVADLQSRFGFDNLQGVMVRRLFVDGEVFVLLTREGQFPRIQLIEAHRCKTPPARMADEGVSVVDGVELDSNGRPVGYWFFTGRDQFALQPAENVVHIFEPARPEQYRGIPYAAAALNVLHDLYDLHILEMKAAKDAADLSTVAYTQSGEMPTGLASMASKFVANSQPLADNTNPTTAESKRAWYQNATGGRVVVALANDKIEQHVPERPGADTREYWRLLASEVCAVCGVPLALVYPDSMQGTVYRGALDSAAAFFRAKSAMFGTFLRRIRNYVVQSESRFNRELNPLPENWREVIVGTVRAPNVDVGRNSAAMISELAAGLRTWSSIAAELGLDGRRLLEEKADELAYIRQLAQDRQLPPELIAAASLPSPEKLFDLAIAQPEPDTIA